MSVRVVEVVRRAISESKKSFKLDLKAMFNVSCGTSRAALGLYDQVEDDRFPYILAEMFAIANHVALAVGISCTT